MNKVTLLGLLFVLATVVTVTTCLVNPPPAQPLVVDKKNVPVISDNKELFASDKNGPVISDDKVIYTQHENKDDYSDSDSNEKLSEDTQDLEQMLCNIIVRATHDLHVYQSKSADDIISYLNTDCGNLENEELVEQCRDMVVEHGTEIHKLVKNRVEMSQICQKIEDGTEIDLTNENAAECSNERADRCRCCIQKVAKRKMRFRYVVKQMAKRRLIMCKKSPRPERCRAWIQRKLREALKKIGKICPYMVCKHLGYCETVSVEENDVNKLPLMWNPIANVGSPSLSLELLDQKLEAHLTKGVCDEFEPLETVCAHLIASPDSSRYIKIYMAVYNNDSKGLDNDLREEARLAKASASVNLCDACKNVIQSSKDAYLQALETVRTALDSTCAKCSAKEKCEEFVNTRIDMLKTYLNSLNPDAFCSAVRLCSSSSAVVIPSQDNGLCNTCIVHLQPRKDAVMQTINRFACYYNDLCAKSDIPQCNELIREVLSEARLFINEFDVQDTCMAMGLCGPNAAQDLIDFEKGFVEEMKKEVCSKLGSFNVLCQKIIQGNSTEIETMSFDTINVDDLFTHCEEETDEKNAVVAKPEECPKDKDKCQCCIDHVIRKKKCVKRHVRIFVWHMLQQCKRCPAREKCEQHWEKKKECWDAKIDKICPKKVCTRLGYCKKGDMSSMRTYFDLVKHASRQTVAMAHHLFEKGHEQLASIVAPQVPVQLKDQDKDKKQPVANSV